MAKFPSQHDTELTEVIVEVYTIYSTRLGNLESTSVDLKRLTPTCNPTRCHETRQLCRVRSSGLNQALKSPRDTVTS